MSIEDPENLFEWLWRLKEHEGAIYVRERMGPCWENVQLCDLKPERWAYWVSRWLNENALPVYVREVSEIAEDS